MFKRFYLPCTRSKVVDPFPTGDSLFSKRLVTGSALALRSQQCEGLGGPWGGAGGAGRGGGEGAGGAGKGGGGGEVGGGGSACRVTSGQ